MTITPVLFSTSTIVRVCCSRICATRVRVNAGCTSERVVIFNKRISTYPPMNRPRTIRPSLHVRRAVSAATMISKLTMEYFGAGLYHRGVQETGHAGVLTRPLLSRCFDRSPWEFARYLCQWTAAFSLPHSWESDRAPLQSLYSLIGLPVPRDKTHRQPCPASSPAPSPTPLM